MTNLNELIEDLKVSDLAGDPWGVALLRLFDVAQELHFHRASPCPDHWDYTPGLGVPDPCDDLQDADDATLVEFGNLLDRVVIATERLGYSY